MGARLSRRRGVGDRLLDRLLPEARREQTRVDLDQLFSRTRDSRGSLRAQAEYWKELAAVLIWNTAGTAKRIPADSDWSQKLDTLGQDVRYAFRSLAGTPTFTLTAVLVLALGIGATSSIFGIIDATLLQPLPFAAPELLVAVEDEDADTPSPAHYTAWEEGTQGLSEIAAYISVDVNLTGVEEPLRLHGQRVTHSFFPLFGVAPLAGRTFSANEHTPGNSDYVVLSHGLWQGRFGADPGVVGRTLLLDGVAVVVLGVMPAGFAFPDTTSQLWMPAGFGPGAASDNNHYLGVVGRLADGVSAASAQAELDALSALQAADTGAGQVRQTHGARVTPLHTRMVGEIRSALLLVLAAAGLVLLIACGNVANLLLTRASSRTAEIALRTALGVSKGRIVRQLLTEAVTLAVMGGVAGLLLATWGMTLLSVLVPDGVPVAHRIGVDARLAAFSMLVSLATVALFGLAPALSAARTDLGALINAGASRGTGGRGVHRLRGVISVAEIALAIVLLVVSGLTMRSFASVISKDPGLATEGVVAARLALTDAKYDAPGAPATFYEEVLQSVRAIPGVDDAGFVTFTPMTFRGGSTRAQATDRPVPPPEETVYPVLRVVGPGYYETTGIPVRGRAFTSVDGAEGERVAVVNEAMVDAFWPGEDALGKELAFWSGPTWRVVGVAGNVRQFQLEASPEPELTVSYLQWEGISFFMPRDLVVRSELDLTALAPTLRGAVRAVDADVPVSWIRSMGAIVDDSVAGRRVSMLLFGSLGATSLVLAALGIYGVISFSVTQRRTEIGVRMALGAQTGDVLRMVLRQGALFVVAGIAIGVPAAIAVTRYAETLLYEVSPLDTMTFLIVVAALGGVSVLAVLVPGLRASRMDPLTSLRTS